MSSYFWITINTGPRHNEINGAPDNRITATWPVLTPRNIDLESDTWTGAYGPVVSKVQTAKSFGKIY